MPVALMAFGSRGRSGIPQSLSGRTPAWMRVSIVFAHLRGQVGQLGTMNDLSHAH